MDVLDDDEISTEWPAVVRRRRKMESEIVQEFWKDAGFPTPASRFGARRSSSPSETTSGHAGMELMSCRIQIDAMEDGTKDQSRDTPPIGSTTTTPPRRSTPSLASGLRVSHATRMGAWRGPLPPRRITPPPVLVQILAAAKHVPAVVPGGSPTPVMAPKSAGLTKTRSTPIQNAAESTRGPILHDFTWANLGRRMKALWSGYPMASRPREETKDRTHTCMQLDGCQPCSTS